MAINRIPSPTSPWEVDYYDPSGSRRRRRFRTKREATDFSNEVTRKVRSGDWVDPALAKSTTVSGLFESWVRRVETVGVRGRKPAKESTVHDYRRIWRAHIEPRWGDTPLDLIRAADAEEWAHTMGTGARTRQKAVTTFLRILDHGVRLELIPRNPAKDRLGRADYVPEAPKQKQHLYLTMEQLRTLVDAMPTDQDKAMVLLAGLSGLRWGEMSALRWGEINLQKATVSILRAYSDVGGRLVLSTTKSGSDRTVPLHDPTLAVLERLRTNVGEGIMEDQLVLKGPQGGVQRDGNWTSRLLRPTLKRLHSLEGQAKEHLPPVSLTYHDLRHTAVSLAISSGANIKVVQRIAGHASATLTLDTYTGLFDSDLAESAERVNSHIASAFSKTVSKPANS